MNYRGRIAPTPTGFLHLGHARTFWAAQERCLLHNGTLLYRNENLDAARCKQEFHNAAIEDCRWFGLAWQGMPVNQSERLDLYTEAFEKLKSSGYLFPCSCTRKDIQKASRAPHSEEGEAIYPGTCRNIVEPTKNKQANWRFRVPTGKPIEFQDRNLGPQGYLGQKDFGDFPVWQKNGTPSYQLAVVVDDAQMGITEVVRGEDLLNSTARQLLLYQALGLKPPAFYHCQLMYDENGQRLAKRHDSMSLRELRNQGKSPEYLRGNWENL